MRNCKMKIGKLENWKIERFVADGDLLYLVECSAESCRVYLVVYSVILHVSLYCKVYSITHNSAFQSIITFANLPYTTILF